MIFMHKPSLKQTIYFIRENMHEYTYPKEWENDGWKTVKPHNLVLKILWAWITNNVCWNCDGAGMTGYYEPEACSTCDGAGLNWLGYSNFFQEFAEAPHCHICGEWGDLITLDRKQMYCKLHAFLYYPHIPMLKVER